VFRFGAIGTDGQTGTEHPLPDAVRQQITALTETFDWVWSRFRADSLVTLIAHAAGGGQSEFRARDALLNLYDRPVAATGGVVDPLVGRDLELLG
jgi:FAD:protein FMN transferase